MKQHALLLNRSKETGMAYRLSLSNMKVLDYARLPKIPVSPAKRVAIIVAVVLAWLLGSSVVRPRCCRSHHQGLRTLEHHLRIARLPRLAGRPSRTSWFATSRVRRLPRLSRLRTSLLFGADRPLKTLLVTSFGRPQEDALPCQPGITGAGGAQDAAT